MNGQAFAHVVEADAGSADRPTGRDAIDDTQRQGLVADHRLHTNHGGALMSGKAVHHCVLDQRLQDQTGHPGVRQRLAIRHRHGQPVRESLLLQLQIQTHELQLIGEARELALAGSQQAAQ